MAQRWGGDLTWSFSFIKTRPASVAHYRSHQNIQKLAEFPSIYENRYFLKVYGPEVVTESNERVRSIQKTRINFLAWTKCNVLAVGNDYNRSLQDPIRDFQVEPPVKKGVSRLQWSQLLQCERSRVATVVCTEHTENAKNSQNSTFQTYRTCPKNLTFAHCTEITLFFSKFFLYFFFWFFTLSLL